MKLMNQFKTILVVAAHPDDELLGCGGTLVKHLENNACVYILILGTGVASRYNNLSNDLSKKVTNEISKLKQRSFDALENHKIKTSNIFLENFPDNQFDTVPLLKIVKTIEKTVQNVKPELIYTHSKGDLNIDHRKTFEAVLTACRPGLTSVKMISSFEIPSSTEFGQKLVHPFIPDLYISLTEKHLEKKISSLRFYESEIREWPFPRSERGIRCLAEYRGMESGNNLSEAFKIVRLND